MRKTILNHIQGAGHEAAIRHRDPVSNKTGNNNLSFIPCALDITPPTDGYMHSPLRDDGRAVSLVSRLAWKEGGVFQIF